MVAKSAVNDTAPAEAAALQVTAECLGSDEFKQEYGLDYAYVAGAMYNGIASK
jgi:trans-AT polyketide synthase, acyltransferase and oxidoreductase domains